MTPRWLPDRSQTLLLRAALLPGDAGREALAEWRAATHLDDLDGGSIRLLPLLSCAIGQRSEEHPDLDRIRGVHRRSIYTSTMLRSMAATVLPVIEASGVSPIVIDGSAIAHLAYGGAPTRPIDDLDLFVRPDEFVKVAQTLESIGFASEASATAARSVSSTHAAFFRRGPLERLRVHRTLRGIGRDGAFDAQAARRATTTDTASEPILRFLSPTDMLLRVFVRAPQPRRIPNCRWAADATQLIRHTGPIDWPRLCSEAGALGVALSIGEAIEYLERHLHVVIPGDVGEQLDTARPGLFDRLHHWTQTSRPTRTSATVRVVVTEFVFASTTASAHETALLYPRYLANTIAARRSGGRTLIQRFIAGPSG